MATQAIDQSKDHNVPSLIHILFIYIVISIVSINEQCTKPLCYALRYCIYSIFLLRNIFSINKKKTKNEFFGKKTINHSLEIFFIFLLPPFIIPYLLWTKAIGNTVHKINNRQKSTGAINFWCFTKNIGFLCRKLLLFLIHCFCCTQNEKPEKKNFKFICLTAKNIMRRKSNNKFPDLQKEKKTNL